MLLADLRPQAVFFSGLRRLEVRHGTSSDNGNLACCYQYWQGLASRSPEKVSHCGPEMALDVPETLVMHLEETVEIVGAGSGVNA